MTGSAAARQRPDLVVVGAGVIGAWTALLAQERGLQVELIDMHHPGHGFGSSGGDSRNIRAAYGSDLLFTRWAQAAWQAWQAREADLGLRMLFPSGALWTGSANRLNEQASMFDRIAQPCELLHGAEVVRRWPHLRYGDDETVFYEPNAGVLLAGASLRAIVDRFQRLGGSLQLGRVEVDAELRLWQGGSRVKADNVLFACGPWLPRLFPDLLGPLMRTPRRELFFFDANGGGFGFDRTPNLVDQEAWTSSDIGNGLKVAPRVRGVPFDPDRDPRVPSPDLLASARAYLGRRIPALADASLSHAFVGCLENTASEDFIIDRHPDEPRWLIAGGGSGHAFKFGPVLGELVLSMLTGAEVEPEARRRFALAAHRPVAPGEAD